MSVHLISATSAGAAGTAVLGTPVGMLQNYDALTIRAALTGPTGGTLDVYLQTSVDGTDWTDYAHFAQVAAAAAVATFGFTVSRSGQQTSILALGSGLFPTLAANAVVGGDFGNQMRAVAVAGVGTTVGAAQVIRIIGTLRRT